MAKRLKKVTISLALSCVLTDASYSSTSCQNGYDYNNRCDPYYNVNLIHAKSSTRKSNSSSRETKKVSHVSSYDANSKSKITQTVRHSDLSYLDALQRKYSNQFNGRMGLQALIDRSNYLSLKKVDKENNETVKGNKPPETEKKSLKKDKTKLANSSNKSKKSLAKKSQKAKNIYIVKKGDSLIKIAKKFSLKKSDILKLNKLDKNATIKVGQKLVLSAKNIKVLAKSKSNIKNNKKIKSNKNFYVVKKGDTLIKIAKKTNISIVTLREINELSRSSSIKVGQKLILKPRYAKVAKSKKYDFVKSIKFKKSNALKYKRKIRVVATAYTSHRNQTDKTPFLAAWNNRIRPGMKIIAVSPDLIRKYGLTNGVKVKILGLPGYYVVRDKMNKRLRNHIDIYMGVNKRRALRWGRRRVALYW